MKKLINKLRHKDKWKLSFYYNKQLIKTIYVDEEEKIFNNFYSIKVRWQKHLFGKNKVQLIVKPTKIILNEKEKKHVHVGVELFEGVLVNE